ncbi:hypothetical protein NKI56_01195 [Mesorhizobium sp. M0622]|uniref:hypothetical protein n=1 Tax=unclassified Mesorhizobium TaxID=325217 RepID=UPI00333A1A13
MRLWIFERTASKRQTIALSQQTRSALDFHYRTVGGIATLRAWLLFSSIRSKSDNHFSRLSGFGDCCLESPFSSSHFDSTQPDLAVSN